MQKLPCEIIVWESLPAIRAAIATEMVASGLSQKTVSDILGMAPSAVSQYLSGKRGYRIEFTGEVKNSIASLATELRGGGVKDPGQKICSICTLIRGIESCGACDQKDNEEESELPEK